MDDAHAIDVFMAGVTTALQALHKQLAGAADKNRALLAPRIVQAMLDQGACTIGDGDR